MACLLLEYSLWNWTMTNEDVAAYWARVDALASFLFVRRDVFRAENARVAQNIRRALVR